MSLTLVSSSLHKIQNIKNKKNTSLLLLGQAHTKLNKEKHPKPLIPSNPYHTIFIFSLMKTSRTHRVREQPKKQKQTEKGNDNYDLRPTLTHRQFSLRRHTH